MAVDEVTAEFKDILSGLGHFDLFLCSGGKVNYIIVLKNGGHDCA